MEGREGRKRGRRKEDDQAEKGPVKILKACRLGVREPMTTIFLWKRTTYLGRTYLNIKQEYAAIKKMAS